MDIYLFLGKEPLMIQNKIDNIISSSHCDIYNIKKYDCEEINVSEAIQDAMTPPFLSSKKIVIIKNPLFLTSIKLDLKHNLKMFIDYLKSPSPSTILIIDGTNIELDKRKDVVKTLLKHANVNESKELTIVEAEGWLKRQLLLIGYTITDDAIKEFFNRCGISLLRA